MGDGYMDIKYGDGLEFEVEKPDTKTKTDHADAQEKIKGLEQIIRHGFRAPVGAAHKISLTIGKKNYPVFNLGTSGVGIYLTALDEFSNQQELKAMVIDFSGKSFQVDGKVVHISKDEAHVLCGIELISLNPECKQELLNHLKQCKKALFS